MMLRNTNDPKVLVFQYPLRVWKSFNNQWTGYHSALKHVSVPSAGLEVLQFKGPEPTKVLIGVSVPSAGLEVLQYGPLIQILHKWGRFSTLCGFGSPSIQQWSAVIYADARFSTLCGFGSPSMTTVNRPLSWVDCFSTLCGFGSPSIANFGTNVMSNDSVSVPSAGLEVLQSNATRDELTKQNSFSTLCGFGSPSIIPLIVRMLSRR